MNEDLEPCYAFVEAGTIWYVSNMCPSLLSEISSLECPWFAKLQI